MRTTVTIDDDTLATAIELTGITERSALIRAALEALIRRESARRLAALGGATLKPYLDGGNGSSDDLGRHIRVDRSFS